MCGIIGYVGNNNGIKVVIDGLKQLEYRWYDSAGLALNLERKIAVVKTQGRVKSLEEKASNLSGKTAIGHTRWATHGKATEINAHPHLSNDGRFAIVHNGIIENYSQLKEEFIKKGYNFYSKTDSEVICALLQEHYKGDTFLAISQIYPKLQGAFAIVIVNREEKDALYAIKKGSPLCVGEGKEENFFASDPIAFNDKCDCIYYLKDGQMARITPSSIEVKNEYNKSVKWQKTRYCKDNQGINLGAFRHYMLKEICEEDVAFNNTLSQFLDDDGKLNKYFSNKKIDKILSKIKGVYASGCGSAYNVLMQAKHVFERLAKIPFHVETASELRYKEPIFLDKYLFLSVSQSGETADTLEAIKLAKRYGLKTLSVVNVEDSAIARESDYVIYTKAGREIAVATTKAYTSQLAVLYAMAVRLSNNRQILTEELKLLPYKMKKTIETKEGIFRLAKKYENYSRYFFIGRNLSYPTAIEGSLKLKEVSYLNAESYPAGELKHGTISLVDENTVLFGLLDGSPLDVKTLSNMEEVKARGGKIVAVCNTINKEIEQKSDDIILIPKCPPIFSGALSVIPLQLYAYYTADIKGLDVDKPKNLAKSVTVE